MKKRLRIFLHNTLYTRHIHTNMLCRMRFLAIRAIAGLKYCPASPAYCPTCKYRCLQRAGVYEKVCEEWAYYGIHVTPKG